MRDSCCRTKLSAETTPTRAIAARVAAIEPMSADALADGSIEPSGPSHAIVAVAIKNPRTAPDTHGRIDSRTALNPTRAGPQPRTASTPASTRREANEKTPAAAITPNEMARAARKSTWIGPCTAATR